MIKEFSLFPRVFSSEDNISHELRTGGNGYFDLKDINEIWGKDLKHREKYLTAVKELQNALYAI